MTVHADRHQDQYQAVILDPGKATDDELLAELRSDPAILFTEVAAQQRAALRGPTPTPDPGLIDEPARWVYYPWRRAVIDVLGPTAFRRLRLDRNRHLITAVEQAQLGTLRVGVIGLSVAQGDERAPLQATVRWSVGDEPRLAEPYGPMLRRETNCHQGTAVAIDEDVASAMVSAAEREGARLRLLTSRDDIRSSAALLAAADRIRCLTPHLHAEMFAELRWPLDPSQESGIDVRSLELPTADLAVLEVLRRPEVVAQLAQWDAGEALGDDTRDRVNAAAAVGVVSVRGNTLPDYARAGSAIEAVWITAERHGLAVQPVSPVFLYAHDDRDMQELSPAFRDELDRLQYNFRELASTPPDEAQALVLKFTGAPRPSVRSRRRALRQYLSPQG